VGSDPEGKERPAGVACPITDGAVDPNTDERVGVGFSLAGRTSQECRILQDNKGSWNLRGTVSGSELFRRVLQRNMRV